MLPERHLSLLVLLNTLLLNSYVLSFFRRLIALLVKHEVSPLDLIGKGILKEQLVFLVPFELLEVPLVDFLKVHGFVPLGRLYVEVIPVEVH